MVLNKYSNNHNVSDTHKKKIACLENTNSELETEKLELKKKHEECRGEFEKFRCLLIQETRCKMQLLNYSDFDIERVSALKNYSEIYEMRERILNEFDRKFNIKPVVKDTPKNHITSYANFKV